MTLEDRVAGTLSRPRLYAVLLGTFAAFALAIAGVGLFGVLSYTVAQRAREIGVRTALGAQVRDIVGLVIGQSMAIAGAGLAAGLIASFWLTGALQKFLFGVTPHDTVSFVAVAALLLAVSVLASIVPARRAARVDPVKVLRADRGGNSQRRNSQRHNKHPTSNSQNSQTPKRRQACLRRLGVGSWELIGHCGVVQLWS